LLLKYPSSDLGQRRPNIEVDISRLHLDKLNPRLPEKVQGSAEGEIMQVLLREFNLEELADSMSENGYFNEEPLVAIPLNVPKSLKAGVRGLTTSQKNEWQAFIGDRLTEFTVVEGNRRLATCKILLDENLQGKMGVRNWPKLSDAVAEDLKLLPVIVYTARDEVIPYLGIRHIVGIQKWDPYAKARYLAKLVDGGRTLDEVELLIGDKRGSARKNYICYKLLEQLRSEYDYDTKKAVENFSYLLLAIGQGPIKRFINLPVRLAETDPKEPVSGKGVGQLKKLASWLFGDGKELPVIAESRHITTYLSHVLSSKDATKYLESTRNLQDAFELTDGEEQMLLRKLRRANSGLESVLGIIHRHKTKDARIEVKKCLETAKRLQKTVGESE
jgi:hypothetical protein